MNEEEANIWYEDTKEDLVKDYLKKMDSIMIKADKDEDEKAKKDVKIDISPEEAKKLMHEYEKDFIKKSTAIRDKYDSCILKARLKEKKKIENKEKLMKRLGPLILVWQKIKQFLIFIIESSKKSRKDFSNYYFLNIKAKRLKAKERTNFRINAKLFPARVFYSQKIWPILHFLNTPNRILKRLILRFIDDTKQLIKKGISKTREKIIKIMKKVSEKMKLIFGFIKKIIQNIVKISKKVVDFMLKVIKVIRIKYFPAKEDSK
jgi:hypothetical protein